jgi:hypothetical protein
MSTLDLLAAPPRQLLHPAFDLRDGVLSYGFSVEKSDGGQVTREQFHVVSVDGGVGIVDDSRRELAGTTLRYRETVGNLPLVDSQWSREDLAAFIKQPIAPFGSELYTRLVAKWREHVEFDHPGKYVIAVCWGLMTYVYLLFPSLPFLHFLGPQGTGKSQALDVLQQLVRLGHKSRATAPATGDLIQTQRVTLLLDQADNLDAAMVDLLTDSYRRGARRTIVDKDKRGQPLEFETFGPKALAGTRYLPEDLADRTILVTTSPARRNLAPVSTEDPDFRELRAASYRWALLNFWLVEAVVEVLQAADNSPLVNALYPTLSLYSGRQADLWLPIEALMDALNVPDGDRAAARDYYQRSQAATKAELPEDDIALVMLLAEQVGEESLVEITSSELLERLNARRAGEDFEPVTVWTWQKLGKRLKGLGVVRGESKRIAQNTARRYLIDGPAVRSLAEHYGLRTAKGGDAR